MRGDLFHRSTGWMLPALLLAIGCNPASKPSEPPTSQATAPAVPTTDAEELRAFAKLYGYVRFFHPSDQAAAADWDRVAVEGARRVIAATDRAELQGALREIFEPLAPTLLLYPEDQPPPPAEPPRDGPVIAWQHVGYGFGTMRSVYASARTERPREVYTDGMGWASISNSLDAAPLRGKRLRLTGWARVAGKKPDERAQLWLRVDGAESASEFFDNMGDRPIVAHEWTKATIEAPVLGPAAKKVVLGGLAQGSGAVWFDDFVLEAAAPGSKDWTTVAITNAGFEAGKQPEGWTSNATDFAYTVVPDSHAGGAALEVSRKVTETMVELFEERPKAGETFTRSLGAGLACRVILGLPREPLDRSEPAPGPRLPGPEDPAVRAAAVVVAWNVLRHFYPYHDATGEDWEAVLDDALTDVLDDEGPKDLGLTLRRLVHRLHDGHGNVNGPGVEWATVPLRLAHVEGRYIVLAAPEGLGVARGDELVSVDGVAVDTLMAERRKLHSGSPQWIDYKLVAWGLVAEGPSGTEAKLELRRDGQVRTLELARIEGWPPEEPGRPYIDVLDDGVVYIDLDRSPSAEIMKRMPEIAAAPGVVFDLRGYPMEDPPWLAHLMSKPETTKWMFVPHIISPDYEGVTSFEEHDWELKPAEPHIAGKVAFITGPGAISYAESLMGYVEGYQLGAIVGAPTAGANGNVNPFTVPGGYSVVFTGMKVTRMDGRQHHVVGVQPTHPVQRTLAGILAGRDEELEAALALVRPATPPKGAPKRPKGRKDKAKAKAKARPAAP